MLREPAARAYSHHQHSTRLGHETLAFAGALAVEDARTADPTWDVQRSSIYQHS